MKKLILALAVVSVFACCKKDDEDEEVKPDYALITLTINATDKYPVSGHFTYWRDNEHRDTIYTCENVTDTIVTKQFKLKVVDLYSFTFTCPNTDNTRTKWSVKHHTIHPKREYSETRKVWGNTCAWDIVP